VSALAHPAGLYFARWESEHSEGADTLTPEASLAFELRPRGAPCSRRKAGNRRVGAAAGPPPGASGEPGT
jgi:hypothetical protein